MMRAMPPPHPNPQSDRSALHRTGGLLGWQYAGSAGSDISGRSTAKA